MICVRFLDSVTTTLATVALDANGNTLSDAQGRSFTWDFENRLTQAIVPGTNGGTTTFKYDPFGRRVQKSGSDTRNYVYDGFNITHEIGVSGNVLASYTYDQGMDMPFAQLRAAEAHYYQADGVDSITSVSNPSGTNIATYSYDSFGKALSLSEGLDNPFDYTGRELDQGTGLHYYRARYYDPVLGRFVSEDPIGFGGGVNKYDYVMNMPITWVDPKGLAMTAAQCAELLEDIERRTEILRQKLAKYDPIKDGLGGWPYRAGGKTGITIPGSHFAQIVGMQANLWIDIAKYQSECGTGPRIPCEMFKTVNQEVRQPVYARTLFELQMEQESAEYMQQFWKDILVGDVLLGEVGTGGAFGVLSGAGSGAGAVGLVPEGVLP